MAGARVLESIRKGLAEAARPRILLMKGFSGLVVLLRLHAFLSKLHGNLLHLHASAA